MLFTFLFSFFTEKLNQFQQNKTKTKSNTFYREWLLTKIVNGERASYSAPKFARMQERTRSQMLEDIVANLANHAETGQIPKPYRRGSWRPIGEDNACYFLIYFIKLSFILNCFKFSITSLHQNF